MSVPEVAEAAKKRIIFIGTGGVSGIYYPTGISICNLVNKGRKNHGVRCSVESTDAAIGMAVATTTTEENEDARLERSITAAGNITVEAIGLHDASADSKASATGAKDEDTDTSGQNVDQQAATQTTTATEQQQQASSAPVATPPGVATVTFATSESTLDAGDRNTLRSLAEYLAENPMAAATVSGFTDAVGDFESNLSLAKQRA